MYLPISTIVSYNNKQGLDLDELYKHLRKHPGGAKGVMISAGLADAEQSIVDFIKNASSFGIQPRNYKELDSNQNKTIENMLASPYSALQGGAGVGKTTTVAKLIETIVETPPHVVVYCLAFTHKAKRCIMDKLASSGLNDSVAIRVSTIHSFIATVRMGGSIPPSFILIDESSMIDIELLAQLAEVVKKCNVPYQLTFIGDDMQLPPITRGEFFRYLVSRPGSYINRLVKCYRTDKPDLFAAYEAIRAGKLPDSTLNFKVEHVTSDKDINSYIGKLIYKNIKNTDDTQYIAWQNKDVFKINSWVQAALLKNNMIGPSQFRGFYVNDRVIYRGENTKQLTNALQGKVVETSSRQMVVQWEDGQQTNVTSENIKSINLAYALTVHCLQGSECTNVIVACYEVDKMKYCLDRRFLYTAASRGKQHVTIVTTSNIHEFLSADIKSQPLTSMAI